MRIGSLFTGYGGLDMALPGTLAWHADLDPSASRILHHHWPDTPNLGDITKVVWERVEPVDILTGGYPCQPFSQVGKKRGTADERHLWPHMLAAIRVLRPRCVVAENVRGHLALGFDRVLGDLAACGMDAGWVVVRASDVGAPHRRERVFVVAHPHGAGLEGSGVGTKVAGWGAPVGYPAAGGRASDRQGSGVALLPTPGKRRAGGHTPTLAIEAQRTDRWRQYAAAITRWEHILGRPSPDPTEPTGKHGRHRLSPAFVEWMMGLPPGHVTAVPGLSNAAQLKALGNGVVPQQARHALRMLGL